MSYLLKPVMLLLVPSLLAVATQAQEGENEGASSKNKSILIKPEEGNKQKYTIVIDGSSVTINGKPVEEFKAPGITITQDNRQKSIQGFPLRGGWNMIDENTAPQNKALLGVVTDKTDDGAQVKEVSKESAAEKAGLKEGDVITKVDKIEIETPADLQKAIGEYKPGDKVTITYKRDGKVKTVDTELTKSASNPFTLRKGFQFDGKDLGLPGFNFEPGERNFRFERLGDGARPKLGLQVQDQENGKGVKVIDVLAESAASKAGLKEDDVITSINGNEVNTVNEVKLALVGGGNADIKINYLRNNKQQSTTIKFPKKLEKASL